MTRLRTSNRDLTGILLGILTFLAVYLIGCHLAHAATNPGPAMEAGGNAALDMLAKDGPWWALVGALNIGLRLWLSNQHRLQQGRLLTALTSLSAVLVAVAAWHWDGAPGSGILTALIAGGTLLLHPAPPAGPPSKPGSVLMTSLLVAIVLIACTAAQRTQVVNEAKHDLINCTAQDLGTTPGLDIATLVAVVNLAAAERAKCSTTGSLDWQCVKHDLVSQGAVLGGCTLIAMITAAAGAFSTPGDRLSAATPVLPGRAEFLEFRVSVAPGATYHTGAGDF